MKSYDAVACRHNAASMGRDFARARERNQLPIYEGVAPRRRTFPEPMTERFTSGSP